MFSDSIQPMTKKFGDRFYANQAGFSLMELLITVSVMAITLGIGIPSFQTFIANARLVAQTNNIVSALNIARSKAISTHYRGIVAPITGTDWTDGFQVFVDRDGNQEASDDEVIQKFEAMSGGFYVKPTATVNDKVVYDPDGRADAGSFYICSLPGLNDFRRVVIAGTGRIRTESPLANGETETGETYEANCQD